MESSETPVLHRGRTVPKGYTFTLEGNFKNVVSSEGLTFYYSEHIYIYIYIYIYLFIYIYIYIYIYIPTCKSNVN